MASHDPIAYTYEADTHCPDCALELEGRGKEEATVNTKEYRLIEWAYNRLFLSHGKCDLKNPKRCDAEQYGDGEASDHEKLLEAEHYLATSERQAVKDSLRGMEGQ